MVRTRKLKKVSFMSRGKKVLFFAKRHAASAYRASKPYAKRGAGLAYRGAKRAGKYGVTRAKAYAAQQRPKARTRASPKRKTSGPRQAVRVGNTVRTRQGVGKVVAIRYSKAMRGIDGRPHRIAVVKFPGRRGEFSRLVFRTSDVTRIK